MREQCVQDGQEKGKGKGNARGQMNGPLGIPNQEEIIMGKSDKAVELVDTIFDEGFELYNKGKTAERHIDYLLDMCGAPHHKKKLKEESEPPSLTMSTIGRPYDAPRKIRVKALVDVNVDEDQIDIKECGPIEGEPYPGDFEGAAPNELPAEEPAKEMTPQKLQNKINTVPNQNAAGLLAAIKGEMVKEMRVGSKASADLVRRARSLMLKRKLAGEAPISMKQAARMAAARK